MHTDADVPEVLTLRLDHLRAGIPLVHASGSLDQRTAPRLREVFDEQLAASPWAVVIDLSAVLTVERGAVPVLVEIASCAGEADVGLCLVSGDREVERVLATARVRELFEIHSNHESALGALS
jgi:anti-anti-sigma factor